MANKKQQQIKELTKRRILLNNKCNMCPLSSRLQEITPIVSPHTQLDILFLSHKTIFNIEQVPELQNLRTEHTFRVECASIDEEKQNLYPDAVTCCAGRKMDTIVNKKPKVVISFGYAAFRSVEEMCGNKFELQQDREPLPSKMGNHVFWHLMLDQQEIHDVSSHMSTIKWCLNTQPYVLNFDDSGIEFVQNEIEHRAAIRDLVAAKTPLGYDIETSTIDVFDNTALILTSAFSTGDKTFVWAFDHPQTPVNAVKLQTAFDDFYQMMKAAGVIVHNAMFEAKWGGYFFGFKHLFDIKYDDTMAVAYVLHPKANNGLDFCTRRYLGFSVKSLSNLDRARLYEANLNDVMLYNGRDAKSTKLVMNRFDQILPQKLRYIYNEQWQREPTLCAAELKGVMPNTEFIRKVSDETHHLLTGAYKLVMADKTVQNFYPKAQHVFNPASDKDVKLLFELECGIKTDTVDKNFLLNRKEPIAQKIQTHRELSKLYSTYLVPIDQHAHHENAGKAIKHDGLIHTEFNPMFTETGRLSSKNPNLQNQPKRARKDIRNVICAAEGYWIVPIDYGQVEYRAIAALSRDAFMIDQLVNNGLDVHMHWAVRLSDALPGKWCKPNDPEALEKFRDRVKNQWTFPLCYGAGENKIFHLLEIRNKTEKIIIRGLIEEFWKIHHAVKDWQQALKRQLEIEGCVYNAFGRPYHAPLSWNELINYPVQGTASGDLPLIVMNRLARKGWELQEPDLIPVLNVHDDLTFVIHKNNYDRLLPIILDIMLDVSTYNWLHPIPLTCEVSVGKTWGSTVKAGTYDSRFGSSKCIKKK